MSVDSWTLQVKSLEQVTQSVTISSDASVLQLKNAIQPIFDIASHRQRLIFQGKVLKDEKQLTEYANLKDGKIIHLVARPADAPSNPSNDEPQTNQPRNPQLFPGMFNATEGYTFITVDANIRDLGENNSAITSILQNILHGGLDRNMQNSRTIFTVNGRPMVGAGGTGGTDGTGGAGNNQQDTPTSPASNSRVRTRGFPSMDLGLNRGQSAETTSLLENTLQYASSMSSLEARLTRTLAALANIQSSLEASPSDPDVSQFTWSAISNASPEQNQTIRSRLRASGNEMAQIGLVVEELANLMDTMTPRLRSLAQDLQTNDGSSNAERMPQLQRMTRIIQTNSMVNQFIGSIMAGTEDPSRRSRTLRSSPLGNLPPRRSAFTYAGQNARSRPPARRVTPAESRSANNGSPLSNNKKETNTTTAAAATAATAATATTATTTTTTTTPTPTSPANKRKGSSSSSISNGTKRQKTSSESSAKDEETKNKDNLSSPSSSLSSSSSHTKKGKGKRRC